MNDQTQETPSSSFDAWLKDVRFLVDSHVGQALVFYEGHTKCPWLFFRICGSLLIILSISLPVLSSLTPEFLPSKDLVVSLVALAVAILSGLSTFFHWHETWRENTRAKLELRELLAIWELKVLAARHTEPMCSRMKMIVEATEALFTEARKVGTANTEGYFKNVRLPEVKK